MNKIFRVIIREIKEAIPTFIFFFVAFHLVAITKMLMLMGYKITLTGSTVATIGALIVAKAVLLANKVPVVNLFQKKPLIFNVLWKTLIYGLLTFVFRYLEELIPLIVKHGSLINARVHLIGEISWPHFWAFQIWLMVALLLYCSFLELLSEFGAGKVKEVFFGLRDTEKNNYPN